MSKRLTIVYMILITIISLSLYNYPSNAVSSNNNHYIIVGHIYPPYNSDIVTLRNRVTNEELTVNIINCNHNLKEYLFDLANLKNGWNNNDRLWLFYGNKSELLTKEVIINTEFAGIQSDFNAPYDYTPIAVITGTVLILSGSYYYIKRILKKRKLHDNIDNNI